MEMFPGPAPPLLPVLDAAAVWTEEDMERIEKARDNLVGRFPQFRWHLCSVDLPAGDSLSVFGFWLLNVCPSPANGTVEDRPWTVLLVLNAGTGQAAAVPGYSAERWLGDDGLKRALAAMSAPWKGGRAADAVIRFFEACGDRLGSAWKTRGRPRFMNSM